MFSALLLLVSMGMGTLQSDYACARDNTIYLQFRSNMKKIGLARGFIFLAIFSALCDGGSFTNCTDMNKSHEYHMMIPF